MLWAHERCNCGLQVAEGQPPLLSTGCDLSHWLEEIHHPYGKLGLWSTHCCATRRLLQSSLLCANCMQAWRAHGLFSRWYNVTRFFYNVLTRKCKRKWHHKISISFFTVWTHQCQCILSPVESQWSCKESGHTEEHTVVQHYSTGQLMILYQNKYSSFGACGFNLYITLAWLPESNSASSFVAMN